MMDFDPTLAVDGIRQFLKLHATCGGTFFDAPALPDRHGYRALAACRCGDTVEYWLNDAVLPARQLLTAARRDAPDNVRSLDRRASTKAA
jgi:hypothetical protein